MSEEQDDFEVEEDLLETEVIELEEDSAHDPGLPTSDPVFPTASPPLKPPVTPRPAEAGASSEVGDSSGAGDSSELSRPPAAQAPAVPAARVAPTPRPPRTAAEIRADIEANRQELSESVEVLRDKVNELTDWRGQIRKHRREITVAAAVVGFTVGARFMLRRRR